MNTKLKKMRGAKQQVRQHEIAALALGETMKMKSFGGKCTKRRSCCLHSEGIFFFLN